RLRREAEVWKRLRHKHIVPFIGLCDDIAPWPVLIFPFYKFGHVGKYLKDHPGANRNELVGGVASGLQFLHDNYVVHGDLKVQNVLVDKQGVACIGDFGISKIIGSRGFTTSSVGTVPYMAPELFLVIDGDNFNAAPPSTTKQSDIYSFGLVALEVRSSSPPCHLRRRPNRPFLTVKVLEALRPQREDYDANNVSAEIWSVLDQCWNLDPHSRPTINEI
ncbi:kinase-like domain-containing protein, partial [Mycena sp. CBHHK59/15]